MTKAHWVFPVLAGAAIAAGLAVAAAIAVSRERHGPAPRPSAAALANPDVSPGTQVGEAAAPPFTLFDQDGRPTSLSDFRGKVVVLAFVDSHCTTICPLMTESMEQALRLLGPAAARVQLLGIDANPQAIRVADVADYTRAHHLEGRWRFLTGSLPALEQVWREYHVYVAALHDDIDHQPIVVLIDGRGRERTIYSTQMSYAGVLQQAELIASGISRLLPGHPPVRNAVSLGYLPPLEPASRVQWTAIGPRRAEVALGKGHPHLLAFFATWLAGDAGLGSRLAVLDAYSRAARKHGWPPVAAVDERPTESSAGGTQRTLAGLAATLRIPIVEDARGRLGDGCGVQDLPWFVLTSRSGRVLWHHDGWLSARELERQVGAALAGR